ncbi:MAG: DUF433 domain-containing protein [Flavobacteriales bacterium]
MADWHQHIASDPEIMYGKPCIKGTRIPVDLILDKLAAGQPIEDLLVGYPQLTRESIQACLRYGADAVRNDIELPYAS